MTTKLENHAELFALGFNALEPRWKAVLESTLTSAPMVSLARFLASEQARGKTIYPPKEHWLDALKATPFDAVKVIIVGQDPYHGPGQAHGLSFSVPTGVKLPPSLRNIYQELEQDVGVPVSKEGLLSSWAQEGVLLLNSVLTVEASLAGSHQNKGWEILTDKIIESLSNDLRPKVFILWGSYAQAKGKSIDLQRHCVIKGVHPSPLSAYRGFFGSKPFSQANEFLIKTGQRPINWMIKTEKEPHDNQAEQRKSRATANT